MLRFAGVGLPEPANLSAEFAAVRVMADRAPLPAAPTPV